MKRLKTLLLFGVLLMVSGCASKHMAVIQDVSPDTYQPGSNDAVIVFCALLLLEAQFKPLFLT